MKNNIKIVEQNNAETHIQWELLKNLDIYTFFLFKLGLYDENNDQILLGQAFKVIFHATNKTKIIITSFFLRI